MRLVVSGCVCAHGGWVGGYGGGWCVLRGGARAHAALNACVHARPRGRGCGRLQVQVGEVGSAHVVVWVCLAVRVFPWFCFFSPCLCFVFCGSAAFGSGSLRHFFSRPYMHTLLIFPKREIILGPGALIRSWVDFIGRAERLGVLVSNPIQQPPTPRPAGVCSTPGTSITVPILTANASLLGNLTLVTRLRRARRIGGKGGVCYLRSPPTLNG